MGRNRQVLFQKIWVFPSTFWPPPSARSETLLTMQRTGTAPHTLPSQGLYCRPSACNKRTFRRAFPASPGSCSLPACIAVSGLVLPSFQAVPACSKRTFRRAFPASPGSCSLHQACPSIQQSKVTAEGLRHPQTGLAATPLLNTVHSSQAGLCCLPAHGSPPGPPGPPALPIPRFGP